MHGGVLGSVGMRCWRSRAPQGRAALDVSLRLPRSRGGFRMCRWCALSRRRFLQSFALSAAGIAAVRPSAAAQTQPRAAVMAGSVLLAAAGATASPGAEPVVLGTGQYRYRVVEGWGELPPGMSYGDAAAVCVDSKDNVYVFTRSAHPVIVFDRQGRFLRSWGEDIGFVNAHGAAIGPDD